MTQTDSTLHAAKSQLGMQELSQDGRDEGVVTDLIIDKKARLIDSEEIQINRTILEELKLKQLFLERRRCAFRSAKYPVPPTA